MGVRLWMLNSITGGCAKRRDDDSSLTKNHALSSRVGQAQGLRNPVFLSIASRATLIRRADAKYGMPSVGNETLSRDVPIHADAILSLSQKAHVTGVEHSTKR